MSDKQDTRTRIVDEESRVRVNARESALLYYLYVLHKHHGQRYARAGMLMEFCPNMQYSQQLSRAVSQINKYSSLVHMRTADESIPDAILDESGARRGRGAAKGERILWLSDEGRTFVNRHSNEILRTAKKETDEETVVAADEVRQLKVEVINLRQKLDGLYEYFDVPDNAAGNVNSNDVPDDGWVF